MMTLSEGKAKKALTNRLARALDKKEGVILVTFDDFGVMSTGVRASGKMHIQAAMTLLNLAYHRSAPAKVRHHVEQALTELRQITERAKNGK